MYYIRSISSEHTDLLDDFVVNLGVCQSFNHLFLDLVDVVDELVSTATSHGRCFDELLIGTTSDSKGMKPILILALLRD